MSWNETHDWTRNISSLNTSSSISQKNRDASKALQVGVGLYLIAHGSSRACWKFSASKLNRNPRAEGNGQLNWSWSLRLCSLYSRGWQLLKNGVVGLWSLFCQEQSRLRPRGPGNVCTYVHLGTHSIGQHWEGPMAEGSGNGSGSVGTYEVSPTGVHVRLLTSAHQYFSSIFCRIWWLPIFFLFLSSCYLFVADTTGCQSISCTIFFCLPDHSVATHLWEGPPREARPFLTLGREALLV